MIEAPFQCLVDGALVGEPTREVINPATAQPFTAFAPADDVLLEGAVQAAERAYQTWRTRPLADRRALLLALASAIDNQASSLAKLLTLEQGKPLRQAAAEVAAAAGVLRHYAALPSAREDLLFLDEFMGFQRLYRPLGVVAGIIPWNAPLLIVAMKLGPALLAGNVVLIKPAPTTPVTTLAFGALASQLAPPGVLQVLGDAGSLGPRLTAHPRVQKISFTGSTQTGRAVMAAAAPGLKRLTLELGGNDPAIVLEDADIEATADGLAAAAFTNAGQVCGAVKRVYVQSAVYENLCAALAAKVTRLVVGDGLDPTVDVGPVQNRRQYDRAAALMRQATVAGRVRAQARAPKSPGYFVAPTLFERLADDHPLVAEEQFAPLLPILPFGSESEVVERANNSPFALTASVWSGDPGRAARVAQGLEAALVCINRHNACPLDMGLSMAKQSGTGWLLGDEGLKEYLQATLVNLGGL